MFLKNNKLLSKGLSWIDIQIIGSAMTAEAEIITYDLPLATAWKRVKISVLKR